MNVTRILTAVVAAGLVAGTAMAQTAKAAPVATKAAAQDDVLLKQGTILYGGNIGWTMSDINYNGYKMKENSLVIAPEINYFVMDNLSIGLIGSIKWQRQRGYCYGETDNGTELIGELVGRYYIPLCNNRIIPYVGATLGGGYGMYSWRWYGGEGDSDSGHNDAYLTTWGAQTGFLVPLTESVMLNTSIEYKRTHRQGDWYTLTYDSASKDQNDVILGMGFLIKY